MSSPWIAIAIAALLDLPLIIYSFVVHFPGRKGRVDTRLSTARAWRTVAWHGILLGFIFWALSGGRITTNGIGLRTDNLLKTCIYGWLGWLVIQVSAVVLQRFRSTEYKVRDYVRTQRMLWPRTSSGRFAMILVHVINPFTEEIIGRGILVLMVHQATGSIVAGVATGLFVCLVTHLYQGVQSLPNHALFFGITAILAYTDGGLGAAIVCHLFADLQGLFHRREHAAWVRQERARRRASPVESGSW